MKKPAKRDPQDGCFQLTYMLSKVQEYMKRMVELQEEERQDRIRTHRTQRKAK